MFKKTKVSASLIAAFGGTIGLAAVPAVAQQQLERVEITGSSIRRIEADTALPVQIVTREEIARTGATSTEQLLQSISAASSQGGINNATGAGNSTYGQSSISLRGLGEDRTLVLVNGRRLALFAGGNGGSVNVNAIPLAAIERVEILKDGASGVYGSDAIAGVVNFILTKDFQGIEIGATAGAPTRSGGGKNQKAHVVAGFGDVAQNRFNVTLSASLERDTALFAKDRRFARTGNIPPFVSAAATGQGNIEGAYNPGNGTPFSATAEDSTPPPPGNSPGRRVGPNPRFPSPPGTPVDEQEPQFIALFGNSPGAGYGNPLAASNQCESVSMYRDPSATTKGAPYCSYDSNKDVGLIPKRDLSTLSGNLIFKFSDTLEGFGDFLYSRSKVRQQYQPSPMRRSFSVTDSEFALQGVEPALLIRPTNPVYNTIVVPYLTAQHAAHPLEGFDQLIGQPLAVTARVFDFGPRVSEDVATQTRLTGGLRGTLLKQDWEVAASRNESKVAGTVPDGYFSQVAFTRVVNTRDDYNPWSLQQSAAFNAALAASGAKYTGATLDATSKATELDGKVSGELTELPAGPLQYAAGLQYREESFVTKPSAALQSGDIAGLGGALPPVDRDRKIGSVFGELNVPIIKGLEGGLAVRWDKYSGIGNSNSYKGSLRYQPVREITLRGSTGTGFRAPTLIDLYQPQALQSSEQFNDTGPGGTGQTDLQVNSLVGGNPKLKPEKAEQYTLGIVAQPSKNTSVSVDYFNVRVKNIIALPSAQEVVSRFRGGDPAYAGLVRLTGNDINFIEQTLQNVGSAKTQGIDLEATHRIDFESSRLDLYLAGTYMIQFDQTSPGGALSKKVGTTVEPNGDPVLTSHSSIVDGVVLRWKHYLSATWTQGPWALTFAQNYRRGYQDGFDLNGSPHYVPDEAIYDANLAFTGVKNLKLAVGVRNLFDKDPPIFIPTSNQFQGGYDITQYDARARFVYFSASYKF
jgi:iron complex outermembrane recepter protein